MAQLPFGMLLKEGGAAMSELTRRVMKDIMAKKKVFPDAARNSDALFKGTNVTPTLHDPTGNTNVKNKPEDNAEKHHPDNSKVPDNTSKTAVLVAPKQAVMAENEIVRKAVKSLRHKIKDVIKKVE